MTVKNGEERAATITETKARSQSNEVNDEDRDDGELSDDAVS